MRIPTLCSAGALAAGLMATAGALQAQVLPEGLEIKGAPVDGAMGFQAPATHLMRDIVWLDSFLIVVISIITVVVTALLAWC
ncbi:MAG: cytochrome c oxidase subunit II, partial [Pseudomonadota bacterium]